MKAAIRQAVSLTRSKEGHGLVDENGVTVDGVAAMSNLDDLIYAARHEIDLNAVAVKSTLTLRRMEVMEFYVRNAIDLNPALDPKDKKTAEEIEKSFCTTATINSYANRLGDQIILKHYEDYVEGKVAKLLVTQKRVKGQKKKEGLIRYKDYLDEFVRDFKAAVVQVVHHDIYNGQGVPNVKFDELQEQCRKVVKEAKSFGLSVKAKENLLHQFAEAALETQRMMREEPDEDDEPTEPEPATCHNCYEDIPKTGVVRYRCGNSPEVHVACDKCMLQRQNDKWTSTESTRLGDIHALLKDLEDKWNYADATLYCRSHSRRHKIVNDAFDEYTKDITPKLVETPIDFGWCWFCEHEVVFLDDAVKQRFHFHLEAHIRTFKLTHKKRYVRLMHTKSTLSQLFFDDGIFAEPPPPLPPVPEGMLIDISDGSEEPETEEVESEEPGTAGTEPEEPDSEGTEPEELEEMESEDFEMGPTTFEESKRAISGKNEELNELRKRLEEVQAQAARIQEEKARLEQVQALAAQALETRVATAVEQQLVMERQRLANEEAARQQQLKQKAAEEEKKLRGEFQTAKSNFLAATTNARLELENEKNKLAEKEREIAALQAQLATAKETAPENTAELDRLKTLLDSKEDQLKQHDAFVAQKLAEQKKKIEEEELAEKELLSNALKQAEAAKKQAEEARDRANMWKAATDVEKQALKIQRDEAEEIAKKAKDAAEKAQKELEELKAAAKNVPQPNLEEIKKKLRPIVEAEMRETVADEMNSLWDQQLKLAEETGKKEGFVQGTAEKEKAIEAAAAAAAKRVLEEAAAAKRVLEEAAAEKEKALEEAAAAKRALEEAAAAREAFEKELKEEYVNELKSQLESNEAVLKQQLDDEVRNRQAIFEKLLELQKLTEKPSDDDDDGSEAMTPYRTPKRGIRKPVSIHPNKSAPAYIITPSELNAATLTNNIVLIPVSETQSSITDSNANKCRTQVVAAQLRQAVLAGLKLKMPENPDCREENSKWILELEKKVLKREPKFGPYANYRRVPFNKGYIHRSAIEHPGDTSKNIDLENRRQATLFFIRNSSEFGRKYKLQTKQKIGIYESRDKGRGAFATANISKNEIAMEYGGMLTDEATLGAMDPKDVEQDKHMDYGYKKAVLSGYRFSLAALANDAPQLKNPNHAKCASAVMVSIVIDFHSPSNEDYEALYSEELFGDKETFWKELDELMDETDGTLHFFLVATRNIPAVTRIVDGQTGVMIWCRSEITWDYGWDNDLCNGFDVGRDINAQVVHCPQFPKEMLPKSPAAQIQLGKRKATDDVATVEKAPKQAETPSPRKKARQLSPYQALKALAASNEELAVNGLLEINGEPLDGTI